MSEFLLYKKRSFFFFKIKNEQFVLFLQFTQIIGFFKKARDADQMSAQI